MAIYKDNNKTKDGRQWYFKVYKDRKPYKSKRFFTKAEAQEEEAKFKLKYSNSCKNNFNIVALNYFDNLKETKKESTYYSNLCVYNNHLKPFFGNMYINNINIQTMSEWHYIMSKKGLKHTYLNKCYSVLCSIFNYAIKNYGLEQNVSLIYGGFEKPKEEVIADEQKLRYITYDEFNKFISVIDDPEWYSFFSFLYYTGMRKGEIQALTWNDIDFVNNLIVVNKTLSVKTFDKYKITSTKTGENRKIKMNKILIDLLKKHKTYMQQYVDYNDNWFVFGGSRFLASSNIDRYKHKYFELSGVREITIHEFRHSTVSLLINEYVRISNEKGSKIDTARFFLMMSNRMGHKIDTMQKTYMHLFPTIQDEIVDILDNL